MVLMETPVCHFGEKANSFELPDIYGKVWSLSDCAGEKGTIIMFICGHCPYVKAIHTRLVEDTLALQKIGVKSVAIMSNDPSDYPEDSQENIRCIAEKFHYPFPYLFDETQEIAKSYRAVCTPDFFGYNNNLELQYRGRLDSSGMEACAENTRRDLVEAMKEVAATGKGPREQIASIGCSIKWKTKSEFALPKTER